MELELKIVKVLPAESGQGQNGEWKRVKVIGETISQYPKKVAIDFWGDKADEAISLIPGQMVKVGVNIESREYNDKWYTDVKAWKMEVAQPAGGVEEPPAINMDETEGDLPF